MLANLSPRLLDALPLRLEGDRIIVDATAIVPELIAGAGLGSDSWIDDLEITAPERLAGDIGALRFGDTSQVLE